MRFGAEDTLAGSGFVCVGVRGDYDHELRRYEEEDR
jgi:hypothetical protein